MQTVFCYHKHMGFMVGLDEVGRGCWAGPLVAGAVILGNPIIGLNDSKQLSKTQREKLAAEIQIEALAIGLGWVTAAEVDKIGLTEAVRLAMTRALAKVTIKIDEIIIDGNYNFFPHDPRAKAIIKADATVPAVSAASIVAKVARDNWMVEAGLKLPNYQFHKHVGYGTALHLAALKQFGICDLHRKSYKPIQQFISLPSRAQSRDLI
jgi:ribonuclease HII